MPSLLVNCVNLLFYPTFFDVCVLLISYILLYNTTLFLFFWSIAQHDSLGKKTMYNLYELKYSATVNLTLTIVLFSMAGVPPFLGFFSKLILLFLLLQANFFFFYFTFFTLLFIGLYFYIQNIRFLHASTSFTPLNTLAPLRISSNYLYFNLVILFILIWGFLLFDDIILLNFWFCL